MKKGQLHVVSTGKQPPEKLADIAGDIHPYVDAIHIREKTKTAKEIYELVKLFLANQVPLSKIIINDRVDVAYATKVHGVHLAYHSLPIALVKDHFPEMKIGCSVHSLEEAQQAEVQGADYITYGHVFATNSKPGLAPRGIESLVAVTRNTSIPVIAIGGIKPSDVKAVLESGAKGVAVMSGVLEADNPLEMAKAYAMNLSI
ncbi:thiazole tautomerase (transcriptional regulator TenI) [Oceanobacillus limi]|uniref:Thiamine-phosphate synthase n=1 Tax=Oceanobacillus limi TaxID=930131 RepID=A0A1I0A8G8_9BACI|nr:thiazole tautomerase TenI [Oceanobacillus limi]SES90455.1 thiazole tautomerase (transcriptional regulator TenI) [Oceanobacillus limi]